MGFTDIMSAPQKHFTLYCADDLVLSLKFFCRSEIVTFTDNNVKIEKTSLKRVYFINHSTLQLPTRVRQFK